jgi:ATP-dependent Clp protease protease subunit
MVDDSQAKERRDEIWIHKFDEEAAQRFREHAIRLVREAPSSSHPIVVYIDSYGGYVDSLAMMIETMDEIPNPIYTVCLGKAMSCGAILLSHGDQRFCGQHSRVMVHEVSSLTGGDVHDMLNDTKEAQRLNRYFMGLLAKNCNIKGGYKALRQMIKERDGREWWMDAQEAKKFGIIDHVGTPLVEAAIVYITSTHKRQV